MKRKIVILAAGKGRRMKSELPKVLARLKGKPMIEYLVKACLESGVDTNPIIVVSPDNKEIISRALAAYDCQYAVQTEQLGTGHALAAAQNLVDESIDHIICLYGDHPFVKAETIEKVAASHNGVITMMTVQAGDFNDWRQCFYYWGRIIRDEHGQIEKNIEFRDASDEIKRITEVNPSMYCFQSRWLWQNLKKIRNHNAQKEYYLTDMVGLAFEQKQKINTFPLDPKEAVGINSQEELAVAESLLI
ncbi:MAG: NTP transferase domain-containing protein [Patescibacteria group bacterium]|nr:NTP transferase domain-containing protein [Patescibacteria group bacterium]